MIPLSFVTTQEIVKLLETINKPISTFVPSDSDYESDESESSQLQPLRREPAFNSTNCSILRYLIVKLKNNHTFLSTSYNNDEVKTFIKDFVKLIFFKNVDRCTV